MKYWPLDVNQPTNEIKFKIKIVINLFGVIYITMELDDVIASPIVLIASPRETYCSLNNGIGSRHSVPYCSDSVTT